MALVAERPGRLVVMTRVPAEAASQVGFIGEAALGIGGLIPGFVSARMGMDPPPVLTINAIKLTLKLPPTLFLEEIEMPVAGKVEALPEAEVAFCPEAAPKVLTLRYRGLLAAETPAKLRALVDDLFNEENLGQPEGFSVEVWPERTLFCRLGSWEMDPKWRATDRAVEVAFTLVSSEPNFRDSRKDPHDSP
jgi:hypothetical protein